jgi:hypothetical protein
MGPERVYNLIGESDVGGHEHASVVLRCSEDIGVGRTSQARIADVGGIVALTRQRASKGAREILVDEEARHCSADGADLIVGQSARRVREHGKHVLAPDPVFARHLFGGQSRGDDARRDLGHGVRTLARGCRWGAASEVLRR